MALELRLRILGNAFSAVHNVVMVASLGQWLWQSDYTDVETLRTPLVFSAGYMVADCALSMVCAAVARVNKHPATVSAVKEVGYFAHHAAAVIMYGFTLGLVEVDGLRICEGWLRWGMLFLFLHELPLMPGYVLNHIYLARHLAARGRLEGGAGGDDDDDDDDDQGAHGPWLHTLQAVRAQCYFLCRFVGGWF